MGAKIWQWLGYYGLLLVSFALLAASSLAARISIEATEQRAREASGVFLESTLQTAQQALRVWVDARLVDTKGVASDAALLAAVRDVFVDELWASPGERHGAEAYLDAIVAERLGRQGSLSWGLVDTSGRGVLSSNEASLMRGSELLRHRPEVLESVINGSTRLLPPGETPSDSPTLPGLPKVGEATLFVVVPVLGDDETVALAMLLELALPTSWLAELVGGANSARFSLFDRSSRLLCSGSGGEQDDASSLCSASDEHFGKMLSAINRRQSVVDVDGHTNGSAGRSLGAWSWDDEIGLGMGVQLNERAALAAAADAVRFIGLAWAVVALALLLTVVGAWIGRSRLGLLESQARLMTERRVLERTHELMQRNAELIRQLEAQRLNEVKLRNAQRNLEESTERFARLSQTDALTNLANRRRFDEFLEREWRLSVRHGTPLSLVLVDIDYFKLFNDAYGHKAGDDCLREVADVLSRAARHPEDLSARLGGEEFALVLCETDTDGARATAQHIHDAVESLAIDHEMTMVQDADTVTVSIGHATLLPDETSGSSLLVYHADEALMLAKQDGRNCIRSYEDCQTAIKSSSHLRSISPSIAPSLRAHDPLGHKGRA